MAGPIISNYGLGTAKYPGTLAPNAAYQQGIEAVLQNFLQPMVDLVKLTHPALDIFGKNKFKFIGERILVPMKIAGPGSFAAGSEYSILPRGSGSKYQQMDAVETYLWSQLEVTVGALSKAAGKGAIIDLLDTETKGCAEFFAYNLQRQLWGDGVGYLAKASVVTGADPYTVTIVTTGSGIPHNTSRIRENATVRWGADATALQATSNTRWGVIRDVTSDTQFVVDMSGFGTEPPIADDYFVMGDDNASSYNLEFLGFDKILDNTATVQNLAPATFSFWKAGSKDFQNGGEDVPIQDEYLNRGCALHAKRNGSEPPNIIFAHDSMEPEIFRALVMDRRFVNKGEYKMGYSSVGYQYRGKNVEIVYDDMAPRNSLVLVDKAQFQYAEQMPMGFTMQQFAGGMWRPNTAGRASGLATYGMIGQFVTMNRRAATKLTGFDVTVDWADLN